MLTTRSEDSVLLFLSLQALQLVLERRSGSMSQACRLAISWELYMLKCGLIGYIFRSLQSKLVSIMGEWVGLGVFPGTNYYC